jgi:putative membrane protein insertion efficiency factor
VNAARRALRLVGGPARAALIGAIHVYRATLSSWLGGECRFYPTCSVYAEEAIRRRGAVIGSGLAVWRVLRCNPFGKGGVEHPPAARSRENVDVHRGAA